MSENAGEHEGAGWSDALLSLIYPASTLVVFGVAIAAALALWTDFRPLAAARDAILNEHMTEQARDRPPPAAPGPVYFVAFDETACLGLAISETECQISGPIDRTYLAKLLKTAHLAHPAAILLDMVPLALEGGCDEGDPTPTLIKAIHEVSQDTPVILPRALVGAGASKADGRTFLDQCPLAPEVERDLLRGDGVFFGHAMLEPNSGRWLDRCNRAVGRRRYHRAGAERPRPGLAAATAYPGGEPDRGARHGGSLALRDVRAAAGQRA